MYGLKPIPPAHTEPIPCLPAPALDCRGCDFFGLRQRRTANHFFQRPALQLAQRAAFLDAYNVADAGGVLLVVGVKLLVQLEHALVLGMGLAHFHLDHDGLLHLGGNDVTDLFVAAGFRLGCCGVRHGLTSPFSGRLGLFRFRNRFAGRLQGRAVQTKSPLTGNGLDASYVFAQIAQLLYALVLPQLHLEAQAKELLGRGLFLPLQLIIVQVANLFRFHRSSLYLATAVGLTSWRMTKRVLRGSLFDARRMASAAISGLTPSISNSTLPGRTTATQ